MPLATCTCSHCKAVAVPSAIYSYGDVTRRLATSCGKLVTGLNHSQEELVKQWNTVVAGLPCGRKLDLPRNVEPTPV